MAEVSFPVLVSPAIAKRKESSAIAGKTGSAVPRIIRRTDELPNAVGGVARMAEGLVRHASQTVVKGAGNGCQSQRISSPILDFTSIRKVTQVSLKGLLKGITNQDKPVFRVQIPWPLFSGVPETPWKQMFWSIFGTFLDRA